VLIPDTYVQDRATKLDLYRRAAALKTQEERQELEEELYDRFGPLPEEVQNLFTAIRFRNKAKAAYVQRLNLSPRELLLTFRAFPNPEALLALISQAKGRLRLYPGDKISLSFVKNLSLSERLRESERFLDLVIKIARPIAEKELESD
jgi:transcription-repair coupling factor (superfamily II helicase)